MLTDTWSQSHISERKKYTVNVIIIKFLNLELYSNSKNNFNLTKFFTL